VKAWEGALIVIGLLMAPVLAYTETGARTQQAAVVSDTSAFVAVTNLAPSSQSPLVLNTGNDFEANALTVRNLMSSTIRVQASLIENPGGRFTLPNPNAVLGVGASATLKIQDDVTPHSRTCTSVVVRLDVTVQDAGGARQGHVVLDRRVFLQVGARC